MFVKDEKRKWLFLSLLIAMMIFMAACGGSPDRQAAEQTGQSEVAETAAVDEPDETADETAATEPDRTAGPIEVGVSWCESIDREEHSRNLQAYIDAIDKAGGRAVLLPLVGDQEEAKAELEKVDALVMTGGEDVDPSYYNEEPDENLKTVNEKRDVSDMALLREAIDEDMPVLCICRGLQVLNVLSGGSLIQDIPTSEEYKDGTVLHRDPEGADVVYHDIAIAEDSQLARITGATTLEVNSRHHQGVKELGNGLKVTARSEDGMIEGIEREDSAYVVAVQFHPEWNVEKGEDTFLEFFTDLIDQARK